MKFVARISREGDKRRIIIIPKRAHDLIETLEGLDLLITLQPIIVETGDDAAAYAAAVNNDTIDVKSIPFKEWRDNIKPRPLKGAAKCTYCGIKPAVIEDWCEECTKAAVEAAKVGIEKDLEKIRRKAFHPL